MRLVSSLPFTAPQAAPLSLRRRSSLRFALGPLLCLTLAPAALLSAEDTPVTFNGAQRILGSGFSAPHGVAVDANRDIFVADTGNNAVKEIVAVNGVIPANPTINTLGSGFSRPSGVAVDANGNVFVADTGNNEIKEILAQGGYATVNTLGTGAGCFAQNLGFICFLQPMGVAVDAGGNVYVADTGDAAVYEIPAPGYTTIQAVPPDLPSPLFAQPTGVAVSSSGVVFVADQGSGGVFYIDGGEIYQIGYVSGATGIAVDGGQDLYVAGRAGLNELLASDNGNSVFLGNGLTDPTGVAVDGSGNIYVAEPGSNQIVELSQASANFGSQPIASPSAVTPMYFTIAPGSATHVNVAVLTLGATGKDFAGAGSSTCLSGIYNAPVSCQLNVQFTPLASGLRRGAVVFSDDSGNVLANVPISGIGTGPQVTFQPGTQTTLASGFAVPAGVAADGNGNIFVADTNNNAVKEILAQGGYTTIQTLGSGFNAPYAVAVDGGGNIFVADRSNSAVKEILAAGGYTTINTVGSGFNSPSAVALDGNGNVFVSDAGNSAIEEILASGGYTTTQILSTGLNPFGLALDASGNIYVADFGYNAVKEILAQGGYTTVQTLGGGFSIPGGVAVDPSGNVYVADYGNEAVKEIPASCISGANDAGCVFTLGSGLHPFGVALDASGNLYVADANNNRVVELDLADPPTISFPTPTAAGTTDTADGVKTVTVWNTGNQPLVFATPATGANPSYPANFPVATDDFDLCAASSILFAGVSCDVSMKFAPTAGGSNTGSIVLTDNALNASAATQSITLSGTGLAASQTIAFGAISTQAVGTPLTLTATSTSGLAVTFASSTPAVCSVSGKVATFLAAGTCTIQASQAGNTSYLAATPVSQSFTVTASPGIRSGLQFIPITPCRIADTRNPTGPFGGPEPKAGSTTTFDIPESECKIPNTAVAYSLNVTVVPNAALGYLTLWPAGQAQPLVSTLNSDGRIKANAAIVPAGTDGGVSVFVSDATQVILDIDGYFVPAGTTSALAFYPVTPCRIADTRNPAGALGGPSLAANTSRAFPAQSSACKLPSTAQAYSLNVTAVPHTKLGYLTIWPAGETQPLVSTLNAPTGAVTANAAIVPAGASGEVSVFADDAADVILDMNGYFAPPTTGGLSLYTATPCRVIDTRPSAFTAAITVKVEGSTCAPPAAAEAYVLNATVVPADALGYLTLWPAGASQPTVSTLNAADKAITSNLAIVPTTNGNVDAFADGATNLILDLSGYFAP
jgi:sugar lactone lactonase YvrE